MEARESAAWPEYVHTSGTPRACYMAINLARTVRIVLTALLLAAYPLFAHFGSVASFDK